MDTQLVIFDMDGLMFDTENRCFRGWSKGLYALGFEPDRDLYISTIGTHHDELYEQFYGPSLDLGKLRLLTQQYMDEIIKEEGIGIKPGLLDLIKFLDKNQIKRAIASSSARERIEYNLNIGQIPSDFDYIISGRELENGKPHPEIFLNVCQNLNIDPKNTIVLEDSLNGVRAAYSAGIKCIVVPDLVPVNEEIKEKAYRIMDSLEYVKQFLMAEMSR